MAIALVTQEWTGTHYAAELTCDSTGDVAKLPEYAEKYKLGLGSTCLCISNSSVFISNSLSTLRRCTFFKK